MLKYLWARFLEDIPITVYINILFYFLSEMAIEGDVTHLLNEKSWTPLLSEMAFKVISHISIF